MKFYIIFVILIFCSVGRAQNIPVGVRNNVNARIETLLPIIQARQAAYFESKGKYFQGLRTHNSLPDGSSDASADRLTSRPSDQEDDWTGFNMSSLNSRFAVTIDCYSGSAGSGYVINIFIKVGQNVFIRKIGVGPENRDVDWYFFGENVLPNGQ